ncbi:MAG TPA: nucleotidyltransferase family protein [Bryobacteraceae bacterium]|nr:nucleotidyltransferase family protein [Bryobacteraceae bacterium]
MANPWPKCPGLPVSAAAALSALHLREPSHAALTHLNDAQWRAALDFCDRSRLTLALRQAVREAMPEWVRIRTDQDAAKNRTRVAGIEQTYRELAARLNAAGAEFIALKGVTHSALFGLDPELRAQYDIDLFAPGERVYAARDALLALGYESVEAMDAFPTDHLPVLIRKTGWEWRGDYFDTGIPLSVDLHFQFWNEPVERLRAPGAEEFWSRRTSRAVAGIELGVLRPVDALGYAALHLLRHLLRGTVSPYHVYEIALLLELTCGDEEFWKEWRGLHEPELRRLEAVVFRLAAEWFGCRLSGALQEQIAELSPATQAWFEEFATSPAQTPFRANKDELWLHCSLVASRIDRWRVARRRLLPGNLPVWGAESMHVPEHRMTWRKRARNALQYGAYAAGRSRHHAAALPRLASSGLQWWWRTNSLGAQFWHFLASAVLFNFALFIFVLLYNLYLVDLGFGEAFLGVVNGANRVGSLAGTLPAALLAFRAGLRKTLLITIAATALMEMLRAVAVSPSALVVLGFGSGLVFSFWAVVLAPIIAGAVAESRRPVAFSTFFAVMLATGIGGNWVGGRLPQLFHGQRIVLLISAAMTALALAPALRLREMSHSRQDARIYPCSGFLLRFLAAFTMWQFATGVFNPFANVYFARLRIPVERIGSIFAVSQIGQLGTILLAPLVFRWVGLVPGIMWMMMATALSLTGLAAQPAAAAATLAFTAYMSFQWMGEPGFNSLLMGHVAESERSGAAAEMYLMAFGAQALAAFSGGALVARFGYGPVLAGAAVAAAGAGVLFRVLLGTVESRRRVESAQPNWRSVPSP